MALAILVAGGGLSRWTFMAFVLATFFLVSASASSAYLTVSEIFPMETRALAIAFFYAVGTAAGGISGPLLFGHLIGTGEDGQLALAFFIGAGVMAVGGVAEEDGAARPGDDDEGARALRERDERIRARLERRAQAERARRYRPGPGARWHAPGVGGTTFRLDPDDAVLDREIDALARAVGEHGATTREQLARLVGARSWGPGRFRVALRAAVEEGRVRRTSPTTYAPPDGDVEGTR